MFNKSAKNVLSFLTPIVVAMIFIAPLFVLGQGEGGQGGGGGEGGQGGGSAPVTMNVEIANPFQQDTITGLINTILNDILIPIGSVIAVIMIMWAGFLYVTAGGDTGKIKEAHQTLLWAVIGAALLLGAKVLSDAISATITQLKA